MLQSELSEGALGNGVATVLCFHHCGILERKRVNDPLQDGRIAAFRRPHNLDSQQGAV